MLMNVERRRELTETINMTERPVLDVTRGVENMQNE